MACLNIAQIGQGHRTLGVSAMLPETSDIIQTDATD